MDVLNLNLTPCYHMTLPYIMGFDIKMSHQRIQTTCSQASCCHQYDVEFVLFHNVACYTNSFLSHIHVNNTKLLKYHVNFDYHACDITKFRMHTTLKYRCPFKIKQFILCPISVEYVGHLHSLEPPPISNHLDKIHLFTCGLKKIYVKILHNQCQLYNGIESFILIFQRLSTHQL